jgi:hypothetical protein
MSIQTTLMEHQQRPAPGWEPLQIRGRFIDPNAMARIEQGSKARKGKRLRQILKKLDLLLRDRSTRPLKEVLRDYQTGLAEMGKTELLDWYQPSRDTLKIAFTRQIKNSEGLTRRGLMIPIESIDRILEMFFNYGRRASNVVTERLMEYISLSFNDVLSKLVDSGKLQNQAAVKVKRALNVAWKSGLAAIESKVGSNIVQQVEISLEERGYERGQKIPKAVRMELAKELGTNYPTINDAISQGEFRQKRGKKTE